MWVTPCVQLIRICSSFQVLQAAAENIELRVKAAPPANNPGSAAVGTYRHNQTQSDSPQPPQQALPGQQASGDNGPGFAH